MSILGTITNYTVTVQASPAEDDLFELVQSAHFMKLLRAQMRPWDQHGQEKERNSIKQLEQINLLQEIDETVE